MARRVIRIERVSSRGGVTEEPVVTSKGYQLADPAHGKHKHHAEHATYVRTLDEAPRLSVAAFRFAWAQKANRPR